MLHQSQLTKHRCPGDGPTENANQRAIYKLTPKKKHYQRAWGRGVEEIYNFTQEYSNLLFLGILFSTI